jgi:hypothetical protein
MPRPARPFPRDVTHRRALRLAVLAWLCAVGAAPADGHPATVATLIGDARCDSDAQCRTTAVGVARCGGAAGYLAWSTQRTEAAALARAVASADAAPADDGARNSTCGVVADPGAYCARPQAATASASAPAAGQCRLRARAPGAAALVDR